MLCYAMLCCAVLCYAMLCYAVQAPIPTAPLRIEMADVTAAVHAAHAAAALGTHMGLEVGGLGRAGRDGGAAGEHGGALFGEVFV